LRLTIFSKPGCHLCDDMKAVVRQEMAGFPGIELEEVDVSTDPALLALYGLEIPVLAVDGKKVAKYRISRAELARLLQARGRRQGI
jgi:hypothetical protein